MKYLCQLVLVSLLMAGQLATAQTAVEDKTDAGSAAKELIDRAIALPGIEGKVQMPDWQADVLKKVLAAWKRPSQSASSATWVMRVKTDSHGRLLNLSWITPTGDRSLNRTIVHAFKDAEPYPAPPDAEAARDGINFTDEATALKVAEAQKARHTAAIEEIKKAGPMHAYLTLVAYRYRKCEKIANDFLDSNITAEAGILLVEGCARDAEPMLEEEVRLALLVAPAKVSDQIKDLYAYTVASLHALGNSNQSIIEARQARSTRSAGIDERIARMSLDL